jgi:hypothetical protein
MECLGVRYFKKYWFVNGSYWNTRHINPEDQQDLYGVIDATKDYTRQHLQQMFFLVVIFIPTYFFLPSEQMTASLIVMGIIMGTHLYAFLVQRYNYLKATDALHQLPARSKEEDSTDDQPITIRKLNPNQISLSLTEPVYEVRLGKYGYGPYIRTREECLRFREYLYSKYGTDTISLSNQFHRRNLYKEYVDFSNLHN